MQRGEDVTITVNGVEVATLSPIRPGKRRFIPKDEFLRELRVGVCAARDTETRARRMATLDVLEHLEVLPIDADAAHEWSRMRAQLGEQGRRITVNDLWIASIALVHGLPVVTQDDDFDVLEDLGGPVVIKV